MTKKSDETIITLPNNIESRVFVLEINVSNIKESLDRLDKRFDKMESSISSLIIQFDKRFDRIDSKFDKIDSEIKELRNDLYKKIDSRFFWLLTFTVAGFGSTWGALAHVAHWF
jgi:chaperonin cofactor prefoldin